MSVGRSVKSPAVLILEEDQALDPSSNYRLYLDEGFDRRHLVFVVGAVPTTFTIGQLTHSQRVALEDMHDDPAQRTRWCDLVVRCGLRAVSGYQVERPDGTVITVDGEPERVAGALGSVITEKWMTETFAPSVGQLYRIAMAIRLHSEVRGPLSRPSVAGSGG